MVLIKKFNWESVLLGKPKGRSSRRKTMEIIKEAQPLSADYQRFLQQKLYKLLPASNGRYKFPSYFIIQMNKNLLNN
jgi:hypothetical protein